MASDVAEHLWENFLSSLEEAETELAGSISFHLFKSIEHVISYFQAIRDGFKLSDILGPERYTFSKNIPILYDLNDALAECRIFANECKELNNKLLLLNPMKYFFIQSMKTRLVRIKLELGKKEVHVPKTVVKEKKKEAPQQELGKPMKKVELRTTLSLNLFGFDEHAKKIEQVLLDEGSSSSSSSAGGLTAIGVVGIAGAGKTTLVEKVLQSQSVKERYKPIIWLPFTGMKEGEQQFSRFGFVTRIFDERIIGLDMLVERLEELLLGKKYLVVMDDVRSQHTKIQDRLWRRLPKGSSGSAVIVTSRLMEVAQKLEPSKLIVALEKTRPVVSSNVFRFHKQAKKLEDFLLQSSTRAGGLITIGVVGIAGRGKTTLVQKVLESKRVKEKFRPIIWVPFSGTKEGEEQFSRFGFETCILDNLGNTIERKILGLDKLLERLDYTLSGKRYLIVLDDVWSQHIKIQDRLWRRLPRGSGGVVIVTSKLMEVAQKLESSNLIVALEKTKPRVSLKVFGFDDKAKKIEELLLRESCSSSRAGGLITIGVVGIAGVGKSTLVQKVLESKMVKEKFNPIIWLPFSGVKEGGQQVSRFSFETCIFDERTVGLDNIWERLDQMLSGKKYLIVLDDVCRRQNKIVDRLWRLAKGSGGGAVIVTSRLMEVVQKLEPNNLIVVEPLKSESCWHIFEKTIENSEVNLNMSQNRTLKSIEKEIEDQCHGLPLAAKTLAEIVPEQIGQLESNRFLKETYIPDELLMPDLDAEPDVYTPSCPVLVFIDAKNKQLGKSLFDMFCYRLNTKQVYLVLEDDSGSTRKVEAKNPEMVLMEVYGNLEKLKQKGYGFASEIQKRMRIVIVGGDAVANWILRVICDLKLPEAPCIVPIPLGTEDDIPISFGWKELSNDQQSVKSFLDQVINAEQMKTDSWHILIKLKSSQSSTNQRIPHSLHLFRPVEESISRNMDNLTLHGGFWNYFRLGVGTPRRYGASIFYPTARTLSSLVEVRVKKQDRGQGDLLLIPNSIKSIICLNLPSFHGERNLWRTENMKKQQKSTLMPCSVDDGFLEIVGQKDVWLAQNESCYLAQVRGISFKFKEGAAEFVNIDFGGAPWKKIPPDRIIDIEVSYHSQVDILANGGCLAKRSNHDSSQPSAFGRSDYDKPKFGGAVTFKKHRI